MCPPDADYFGDYDLSSRVTIYSEFRFDQRNVKMSCLWRISQRMTRIFGYLLTFLLAPPSVIIIPL